MSAIKLRCFVAGACNFFNEFIRDKMSELSMKIFEKISNFLFGKQTDIFDESGKVSHDVGDAKWKAWDRRFHDEDHNWHHHKGFIGRSARKFSKTTQSPKNGRK